MRGHKHQTIAQIQWGHCLVPLSSGLFFPFFFFLFLFFHYIKRLDFYITRSGNCSSSFHREPWSLLCNRFCFPPPRRALLGMTQVSAHLVSRLRGAVQRGRAGNATWQGGWLWWGGGRGLMGMHGLLFWLKVLQKILVPRSAVARKIEFFCMILMKRYLTVHNKE